MKLTADKVVERFRKVASLAGEDLNHDDLRVQFLASPHQPTGLPVGTMAVYVFSYGGTALKVGKAGPNSNARYRSQHYNPGSARSTLAASILKDRAPVGNPPIDVHNVGDWIKNNTDRTNFLLNGTCGIEVLSLLEAFVQCLMKPVYEGFASQR